IHEEEGTSRSILLTDLELLFGNVYSGDLVGRVILKQVPGRGAFPASDIQDSTLLSRNHCEQLFYEILTCLLLAGSRFIPVSTIPEIAVVIVVIDHFDI